MIARSKPLKKCPHCNKPAFRRGVCRGCYFQAKRRIKARETTDEKLSAPGRPHVRLRLRIRGG